MGGVGSANFGPDNDVTAAEAIVALARLSGTKPEFPDIWSQMLAGWSDGYDNWIAELKLLEGNKEMSDTLTGAEMDSMISKVAESMGKTYTAVDAPATRAGFAQRLASLIK